MNYSEIKKRRLELGKTQRQVADACGIKAATYCDIENGKKGTKPKTAQKIAAELNLDWTEFYKEEGGQT